MIYKKGDLIFLFEIIEYVEKLQRDGMREDLRNKLTPLP